MNNLIPKLWACCINSGPKLPTLNKFKGLVYLFKTSNREIMNETVKYFDVDSFEVFLIKK